ncbi:MAG TPA: shikimate kinase [Thermoanaerobaculia bacterium]|nr:shikimate kinase [Thermoanaerobaculia bacterium]
MAAAPGRIYLVGFMGSGKTTAGRALAGLLGVPFVDLDLAFEAMAGRTIRETFETHGEPWFREREAELLRGTASLPSAVVALGGGTFSFAGNREFVRAHGLSVFLDVPFEVIAHRLAGKTADRPLFPSEETARELWEARLASYRMADRTLDVTRDMTAAVVAGRIADLAAPPLETSGGAA